VTRKFQPTGEAEFLRGSGYPLRRTSLAPRRRPFDVFLFGFVKFRFELHHLLLEPYHGGPLLFEETAELSFQLAWHVGFLLESLQSVHVTITTEVISDGFITANRKRKVTKRTPKR
jgi:hypothetical protein